MAYIVQTGPRHPGNVLYICRKPASGRRPQYSMEGYRDQAERFPDEVSARLAITQFSSLYGLEIREI